MSNLTADIESLQAFAVTNHEAAFAHLCTAALAALAGADGEEWASMRLDEALQEIAWSASQLGLDRRLEVIRATDTSRPDGATPRSIEI